MYSTIKVWIDLSKSDLNSSKILHENGHYRNSYFLFQQTTEKANKAFALISEILTETELKTIQHDQTKIYRKAIVKQEKNILEVFIFIISSRGVSIFLSTTKNRNDVKD